MSTATQQKLHFKRLAADKVPDDLRLAKRVAAMLGETRQITIEDVRNWFAEQGMKWTLGNAAGSVFDGGEWESCGFAAAKREESHGRIIRVWRLRGNSR